MPVISNKQSNSRVNIPSMKGPSVVLRGGYSIGRAKYIIDRERLYDRVPPSYEQLMCTSNPFHIRHVPPQPFHRFRGQGRFETVCHG